MYFYRSGKKIFQEEYPINTRLTKIYRGSKIFISRHCSDKFFIFKHLSGNKNAKTIKQADKKIRKQFLYGLQSLGN